MSTSKKSSNPIKDRVEQIRENYEKKQASKKLSVLLTSIQTLKFIEYADPEETSISTTDAWKRCSLIDLKPTTSINEEANKHDLSQWLVEVLQTSEISNMCYLSISETGSLPWAKILIDNSGDWLIDLWYHLGSHNFVILSSNQKTLLGFSDEEYSYEAFILPT